jgi:hypothetical protein
LATTSSSPWSSAANSDERAPGVYCSATKGSAERVTGSGWLRVDRPANELWPRGDDGTVLAQEPDVESDDDEAGP